MERQAAMQLLNTLAQGIDPHSGESFPADSPYQHPDTVRALHQAVEALAAPAPGRRSGAQGIPENAGKPWSDDEDRVLAEAFDAGKPITELAQSHRRTRAARPGTARGPFGAAERPFVAPVLRRPAEIAPFAPGM